MDKFNLLDPPGTVNKADTLTANPNTQQRSSFSFGILSYNSINFPTAFPLTSVTANDLAIPSILSSILTLPKYLSRIGIELG